MKPKILTITLIVILIGAASWIFIISHQHWRNLFRNPKAEVMPNQKELTESLPVFKNQMKLTSFLFYHNGGLPLSATCDGKGVNPPFDIAGVHEGAKALALIVKDPDAPGATFIHWTVWNIDPQTTKIKENSVPDNATQGITSARRAGYIAACPPSGTHHYIFSLYALDKVLDLPVSTTAADLEDAMEGHILNKADLTGLYV